MLLRRRSPSTPSIAVPHLSACREDAESTTRLETRKTEFGNPVPGLQIGCVQKNPDYGLEARS
jgi:hypothetical protein